MKETNSLTSESALVSALTGAPRVGRPRKVKAEGAEGGSATDNRKQSLYFGGDIVDRAKAHAERLDRSLSWVFQRAFEIAEAEIAAMPDVKG